MTNNEIALAHLSICLDKDADMLETDDDIRMAFKKHFGNKEYDVGVMVMSDLRKASRILAELAKVKGYSEHGQTYMIYRDETQTAYEKCLAIAEEGSDNG